MIPEGKIRFPIPSVIVDKDLPIIHPVYIIIGYNLYAYRHPLMNDGKWMIRVADCCRCGACCRNMSNTINYGVKVVNGRCEHQLDDGCCDLGMMRPQGCMQDAGSPELPSCTLRFEELK